MAEREAYARGWAEYDGVECHPGVEIREGDDVDEMTHWVQLVAFQALRRWHGNHLEVCRYVEEAFKAKWGDDRAYFIETEEEGRGVQVYQPWGMPRVGR